MPWASSDTVIDPEETAMKRLILLSTLVILGASSILVAGFQAPAGAPGQGREGRVRGPVGPPPGGPPTLDIKKVKENLWMITGGGGGNTVVFQTANGLVVVDTKLPGTGQAILDKIKTVTPKPITTIINTHTHIDHVGSNDFFGSTVEFIAHENTKAHMKKMDIFNGEKSVFLPKKTYRDTLTIGKGNDEIDLFYFGPAHTSGDTFVVFKAVRAMHAGDAFAGKNVPIVDTNNGGSVINYGKTVAKAASTIKNVDTVIGGHTNDPMTFADLKQYSEFNNDFAAWIAAERKAGKTAEQAGEDYKIPEKYTGYGLGAGRYKGNIRTGYKELDAK
jgi:glyoxylase-like metal-dependent hydrolase (beta-lactamase superfamily II)